jgi:hypothetical protein
MYPTRVGVDLTKKVIQVCIYRNKKEKLTRTLAYKTIIEKSVYSIKDCSPVEYEP